MRKTFLPDINIWLALAFDTHAQPPAARAWVDGVLDDSLAFCRVTQAGFPRLATNSAAFPNDAKTLPEAWNLYDRIRTDRRVTFVDEPSGIEQTWQSLTRRPSRSITAGRMPTSPPSRPRADSKS